MHKHRRGKQAKTSADGQTTSTSRGGRRGKFQILTAMGFGNVGFDLQTNRQRDRSSGVKNVLLWNKAFLGKYVRNIANKNDSLWLRWINHIYMKGKYR